MNRTVYFDYIEEHLNVLATRINRTGKLNQLQLHNHSEDFYKHLCKELYGWDVKNLNEDLQNVEAIDLVCDSNLLVIQISATCTKEKVEGCLDKGKITEYPKYTFKFISIAKDADDLRKKTFKNPHGIAFDPTKDIIDTTSILSYVKGLDIKSQKKIYNFVKSELGNTVDIVKLDSNLATVVNVLAKEDWEKAEGLVTNSFEIDRKISFNNLNGAGTVINDYGTYHPRLDKIYSEFDTQGVNKSNSVLNKIRTIYLRNKAIKSDDELFFLVIDEVQNYVLGSANFTEIPIDELEVCINILVVDAFIRCKIFENPEGYKYANT